MMHDVTESAPGLREQRRAETERRLAATARRLTVERGLGGFTVEELCEEVGVARRTFFNYFASKEDAVLGFPVRRDESALDELFVAQRDPRIHGLSPNLVDDFVALMLGRWAAAETTHDEAREVFAAVDREPRLLARALEHARAHEERDTRLVERREGLEPGDVRAAILIQLVGALVTGTAAEYFTTGGSRPLPDLLAERVAAARELFTTAARPAPIPEKRTP